MPIEYEIDAKRGRIQTRCIGDVRLHEVLAHLRGLEGQSLPIPLDVLLDFSELTFFPDSSNMQEVGREVRHLADKLAWGRCAIVAPSDAAFGTGRMFEMISEPSFQESMVFRQRTDAERWLDDSSRAKL